MVVNFNNYINVIKSQLNIEKTDWNFKSNNKYQEILEHVSYNDGINYYNLILKEFGEIFNNNKEYILNIIKDNDKLGNPFKKDFDFIVCSPTNLRYLYHALVILNYIKSKKVNNINLIEIGGGYGGLILFIYKLKDIFNINIITFTIFDLDDVMILQKEYLKYHNIDINTFNISNFDGNKFQEINTHTNFLISNYAFSECDETIRNLYTNKLLNPFINYGFLIWDFIPIYKFIEKELLIEIEKPDTNGNNENRFIYF